MVMDSGLQDLWIARNSFSHDESSSVVYGLKSGSPVEKQLLLPLPTFIQDDFLDLPIDSYLQTTSHSPSDATSLSTSANGFSHGHLFVEPIAPNGLELGERELFLEENSFEKLPGMSTRIASSDSTVQNGVPPTSLSPSVEPNSSEDSEDMLLSYISNMLMEEEINGKFDMYFEDPALLAAEKPFYEILSEKFPSSPDQPPLSSSHSAENPGDNHLRSSIQSSKNMNRALTENTWPYDPLEFLQLQTNPVCVDLSSQSSFSSSTSSFGNVTDGFEEPLLSSFSVTDLLAQSQPALQFQKGLEEARKFLPSDDKLVIDLEANGFHVPHEQKEGRRLVKIKLENEEREPSIPALRGRKNPHDDDLDVQEGRSIKQSAASMEETLQLRDEFDRVLLANGDECIREIDELRAELQNEASKNSHSSHSKGLGGGRGRGKKQPKREVIDLTTLLIHCAQSVATDDRRNANELLKQIRKHSSMHGDANQRLAHYFADGLEARLAGTGIQNYHSIVLKEIPITHILKAYKLYMAAFPFKRISYYFSNQTILNVAEKAKRVHIIDYGINYGFQWPCFMQRLSSRPGGPPRLRITAIDTPMPGFRPTELIDETGRRLADYAKTFDIPFEYHAIADNWETIKVEDFKIDKDELLIVNSLYQFRKLVDETVLVDGPRDMVLNTIRQLNPAVFIHGIINGSYSAPFFVTRFREALFHFSACFDMTETSVPREDDSRKLIERLLFAREAINVISCEGSERMERPETYKQWQARNLRSGFTQLPLNPHVMKKAKDKFKPYHKDFVIDEDNQWLLQGWKGRILYALSTWRPSTSL